MKHFVGVVVLAALLAGVVAVSQPDAIATPSSELILPQDCYGPLRSAIARGRISFRDPDTGEAIRGFSGNFNPGDYHGTAGISDFLLAIGFDELRIARFGCSLPVPLAIGCVDFNADDHCQDPDGDGYWNSLEAAGGSDPHDSLSTPEYGLLDEQSGARTCVDEIDNNLNGKVDSRDPSCRVTCKDFGTSEQCRDGDGDGWRNYVERMLFSDPMNAQSVPEDRSVIGTCADGNDNDRDGFIDSLDFGCDSTCGSPERPACDSQPYGF